jgi:ubiquinone/menaquinone biosynthesis C-methylase UbiE
MTSDNGLDSRVREANRRFYDIVADVYEEVDGRRTGEVLAWLGGTLKDLSEETSGSVLLDFGCGNGVVMECGHQHFRHTYGIDLSLEILKAGKGRHGSVMCGEASAIPIKDNSVDVVVCFAVLHHILNHTPLVKELYRVLKKGGILYTDHDMDSSFNDRFRLPLRLYRYVFDAGRRYMKAKREVTKEMYRLSEIHADGIDSTAIMERLKEEGFKDVVLRYHWFGLSGLFNRIMRKRGFSRGLAPLVSIRARK